MSDPAPLFVHGFDLAQWILGHFAQRSDPLSAELCTRSLALLDQITLALQDRDRELNLEAADETLTAVRLRLRLAEALGWLDARQLMHAIGLADAIGRQIGGWQRKLSAS
jgi:hypothetical protein